MHTRYMHPADQICTIMRRVYDRELTTLTGGNLSILDDEGVMWVSPTSIDKATLKREDIVRILPDGTIQGKYSPTSEYRFHAQAYRMNPNMRAVMHAHSPAMTAMSVLYEIPDVTMMPATWRNTGQPALIEYAMPGSLELVDLVGAAFAAGHTCAVLKNHSAIVGSDINLYNAFCRFEQFDLAARIQCLAASLGGHRSLSEDSIAACASRLEAPLEALDASRCSIVELDARRTIAQLARRAYARRLFSCAGGSISIRTGVDSFVISPADKDNFLMEPEDAVAIEHGRAQSQRLPDRSVRIHMAIYSQHPDVHTVIVAQPVHATAYAVSNAAFDTHIVPESYGVLRTAQRIPFETLLESPRLAMKNVNLQTPFALLENYAVVVAGANPTMAFDKLEVAEGSAEALLLARMTGHKLHPLDMEELLKTDKH